MPPDQAASESTPNPVLDAALSYAARGWPVFPLKPRGKTPATKHGHKDATTNEMSVRLWFETRLDANLGIRTGNDAGLWALDVDPRHDGDKSLAALEATHGPLPKTVRARTGGGGEHYFFRMPERGVRNSAGFAPGLDTRGEGGYVAAAPSVHESGGVYAWQEGSAPGEVELADAPEWLLELVAKPVKEKPVREKKASKAKQSRAKPASDESLLRRAREYAASVPLPAPGERNNATFKLAGHLLSLVDEEGSMLDDASILSVLKEWNARGSPPLPEPEVEKCLQSAIANGTPREQKPPQERRGVNIEKPPKDGRERIVLWAGEQHEIVNKCIEILAAQVPPGVFQRAKALVRTVRVQDGQGSRDKRIPVSIHTISDSGLADILNQRIEFLNPHVDKQTGETEYFQTDCPLTIARWMLARGEWRRIQRLVGILCTPTILHDGRVLQTPGYDVESSFYLDFEPRAFPPVPAEPTLEDAKAAMANVIAPVFQDFPFERPQHRSVAISGVMSAVTRCAFPTVPAHGYSAPVMASGKSLLADVSCNVAEGRDASPIAQAETDEEFEKRIHSVQLEGQCVAVIDNVQRPVGSDALCTSITSTSSGIRKFRTQEIVRVPTWSTIWLITGNNLTFEKDFRSRVLLCRIDPELERPENRTFKILNLRAHVREQRGAIVAAVLTIVRAYILAGRPKQPFKPLNRFEEWSDTVRAALVWIGEADPVETMDEIARDDESTSSLIALLAELSERFGPAEFAAADVIADLTGRESLKRVLDVVCPSRGGDKHDARRLGRFLQQNTKRVVGGLRLELSSKAKGTNHYRVREVSEPDPGGSGGRGGSDPYARAEDSDVDDTRTHAHAHAHTRAHAHVPIGTVPPLQPLPPDAPPPDVLTDAVLAGAAAHEASMGTGDPDDDGAAWRREMDNKESWV